MQVSLGWFKGKSTGNHGFYHEIWGFPVNFPIIQFYESNLSRDVVPIDIECSVAMLTEGDLSIAVTPFTKLRASQLIVSITARCWCCPWREMNVAPERLNFLALKKLPWTATTKNAPHLHIDPACTGRREGPRIGLSIWTQFFLRRPLKIAMWGKSHPTFPTLPAPAAPFFSPAVTSSSAQTPPLAPMWSCPVVRTYRVFGEVSLSATVGSEDFMCTSQKSM